VVEVEAVVGERQIAVGVVVAVVVEVAVVPDFVNAAVIDFVNAVAVAPRVGSAQVLLLARLLLEPTALAQLPSVVSASERLAQAGPDAGMLIDLSWTVGRQDGWWELDSHY
jgi:hypothetical protein